MPGGLAQKDLREGPAVDVRRRLSSGDVHQRRKEIAETDQGAGTRTWSDDAGPLRNEWHVDAGIIQAPLGKGPLRSVVGRVKEKRVLRQMPFTRGAHFAELLVGECDVGVIL